MISTLIFYLAIDHIATFWAFLVLLWIAISIISGYILKDRIDCIISSAFTSGVFFILIFLLTVAISGLMTLLLEIINPVQLFGIDEARVIVQGFVVSIIVTLIIAVISISFSFLGLFISNQRTKSQQEYSSADYESQFFEKYESPSDAGRYHQKDENDEN